MRYLAINEWFNYSEKICVGNLILANLYIDQLFCWSRILRCNDAYLWMLYDKPRSNEITLHRHKSFTILLSNQFTMTILAF
jgi:hypothetical protein